VEKLFENEVTPVIWWEPTNPKGDAWVQGKYERYARILDGKHDKYIRDWAIAAREAGAKFDRPVLVRFAQEANGHFFPWSIGNFDNTVANYKAAWRYVWRIFKQVGARPYAKFLWSVNKQDCNNCNPFSKVYPGSRYVDYAGLTAFNWGRWQGRTWKSMVSVLESGVRDMMRVTSKPIIVAELASHFKGGDKAQWIRRGYKKTRLRWPRIKAILYLDTDEPHIQSNHPDWRLVKPGDGSAVAAYSDIAAMGVFQSQLP
jgi:beta-mannanase